jgi:hypothetical protein
MIATLLLAAAVAAPLPAAESAAGWPADEPRVTARVEPAEVTVGDRVRVEIEVALPSEAPPLVPAVPHGFRRWGDAEVLAAGSAQRLSGAPATPTYRLHLVLAAFAPGEVELPPVPLVLAAPEGAAAPAVAPLEVITPAGLGFVVRSVLPAEGSPTPQPPAPPRRLPAGAAFWWTAGALALAAALAAGALAWRPRAAAAPARAPVVVPPLAGLLGELESLAAERSVERLHTRLSSALRRFLAGLLGIAAVEHTTSEIDRELRRGPLAAGTRRDLIELLRRCDEVKFARRAATPEEVRQRLAAAADLGAETERQLHPPPVPESSGTASAHHAGPGVS